MTLLVIVAAWTDNAVLAADIALIQGAIMAVFLSISANARNLVLGETLENAAIRLQKLRIYSVAPATVLSWLLLIFVDVAVWLVACLLLRKVIEWLLEVPLAAHEKSNQLTFGLTYIVVNGLALLLLLLSVGIRPDWFKVLLAVWALLPAIFLFADNVSKWRAPFIPIGLQDFSPYFAGTVVVGATNYLFRVVLVFMAGKVLAGNLIAGFAVGAIVASLYTYALGPALIYHKQNQLDRVLGYQLCASLFIGVSLLVLTFINVLPQSHMIWAIGFSVIGAGLMVLAQHSRMCLIQLHKLPTVQRDVAFGVLLVGIVMPLMNILMPSLLVTLFFVSGLLSWIIYRCIPPHSAY